MSSAALDKHSSGPDDGCSPLFGQRRLPVPLLDIPVGPDFEALRKCILRKGTPTRVHYIELFLDAEIISEVANQFGLCRDLDLTDPLFPLRRRIEVYKFLGYDTVPVKPGGLAFPRQRLSAPDTTQIPGQARAERTWTDEHRGPVTTWDDFERYPWPDPARCDTTEIEWLERNIPENMAGQVGACQILEQVTWLMGYEMLCFNLHDEPDLVDAMFEKVGALWVEYTKLACQFSCVGVIFGSDDMGFKTQTMISPQVLREKALPWHQKAAEVAHSQGKLYFLHSCGNLEAIMRDLIEDVRIDAKHSFEDTIVPVTEMKQRYGSRIALLGGIDVDFLCRNTEEQIRRRVRETLDICHPGGGYCLGTGNSVANYIPLDNYLVMLDEGRRYCTG